MQRFDDLTQLARLARLARTALFAAPALLLGCPGPEGEPGADGGVQCGGLAGTACAESEFCNQESAAGGQGCEVADGTGICQALPSACTREFQPVCGCDGKTYDNDCVAHSLAVSISRPGACDADAGTRKPCGGFAGAHCDEGEFCNFEGSQLVCGRFDGLGFCDAVPGVCTFENRPVCGCDGDTYPTACAAHASRVSVEHDGACTPTAP